MKAPATDKFAGDGVMFRAKLFGTADVNEARGQYIHTYIYTVKCSWLSMCCSEVRL